MGYREEGYLPDAVVNMLALLGWNPGTEQEIFSLKELTKEFSLERVNKAGAKFDPEKAKWFQHHYLQDMEEEILISRFKDLLRSKDIDTQVNIAKVVSLVKERATFVKDLWDQTSFFFVAPTSYEEKAVQKAFKEDTLLLLQKVISLLKEINDFSEGTISEKIKGWIISEGIGFGKVMMPLRLSLVGEMKGPEVFDIMEILGKEDTIKRIEKAIKFIS